MIKFDLLEDKTMPLTTKQDISGLRFGRLIAIKFIPDDSKYAKFLFMCDCGKQLIVLSQSVRSVNTLSCGCLHNEITSKVNYKHGHSGKGRTKTYNSWASMMTRCEWGNHSSYKSYGAKGIRVCADWFRYENFLFDMGERPNGKSIDRID